MQILQIHARTRTILHAAVLLAIVIFFVMINNNDTRDDIITVNPYTGIVPTETIDIESAIFAAPCRKIPNTTKKSRGKNSLRQSLHKTCAC